MEEQAHAMQLGVYCILPSRHTVQLLRGVHYLHSRSPPALGDSASALEPHNPRTTPTKAMMNIASAILGVVYILLFS